MNRVDLLLEAISLQKIETCRWIEQVERDFSSHEMSDDLKRAIEVARKEMKESNERIEKILNDGFIDENPAS